MRPQSTLRGQSFAFAFLFIEPTSVAKSGVKGPLICGINVDKSISINSSK